jgi:DNA-directed RNA polymerase specialized sigma24 family protein
MCPRSAEAEPIDNQHSLKEIETRWRELWPKLLLFGNSIVSSNPCCARVSGEDLVQEAVLRIARGTRVWNPKTSTLDSFLFGVVMSCASEQPRKKENRIPHLDYELLNDSIGLPEQPHHVSHQERQKLFDFIKSLRDDPPAYNIAAYMVKFGIDNPDQLSTILVMDNDKVIATKRRIVRRAVKWQCSRKTINEKYQVPGDE